MTTLHITNGDTAAISLRIALTIAQCNDTVLPLSDDLAFGSIQAIDDDVSARTAFWQHVLNDPAHTLMRKLNHQHETLSTLTTSHENVVIWHAQSASDQLTLRRVVYHLRTTPQRLNEVVLTGRDLPTDAPRRLDGATAVSLFSSEALTARVKTVAPISVLRIGRLAFEWQTVKRADSEMRCWHQNMFTTGSYAQIDSAWLDNASDDWQPATQIAVDVMACDFGVCLSETITFWRCRELAAAGRLVLRGDMQQWSSVDVKLPSPHLVCRPGLPSRSTHPTQLMRHRDSTYRAMPHNA